MLKSILLCYSYGNPSADEVVRRCTSDENGDVCVSIRLFDDQMTIDPFGVLDFDEASHVS